MRGPSRMSAGNSGKPVPMADKLAPPNLHPLDFRRGGRNWGRKGKRSNEKGEPGKAASQALRWPGSATRKQGVTVTGRQPGSLAHVWGGWGRVQPCDVCQFPWPGGPVSARLWVTPSSLPRSLSAEGGCWQPCLSSEALVTAGCACVDLRPRLNLSPSPLWNLDLE